MMTNLPQRQVGVRHLRPDRLSDLLDDFEAHTGARYTVAFGDDGVALGQAGARDDGALQARAEQSASSAYMLCSLSAGFWRSWPESHLDAARFGASPGQRSLPADYILLRHTTPESKTREKWWVLVVPAPWGGLCTELPPGSEVPIQVGVVLKKLQGLVEAAAAVLREAHEAEGGAL